MFQEKKIGVDLNDAAQDSQILNDNLYDISKTISSIDLKSPFESAGKILNSIVDQVEEIPKAIQGLDQAASKLVQTLGVTRERAGEFVSTISSAVPMFAKMGLNLSEIATTFEGISGAFGTNVSLNEKALSNLKATSIVTGQGVKELAGAFKDVGVSINDVGDRMLEVTKIARQSGALVSAVSAGVVANLGKMNLYNFEGGTKGLAKMAAQASKVGVEMGKVFTVVEKVFDPEGAIDLAAGLQRLGVTSSQLLDPLRLMDLAQNDPAELQNQIVEMTKEFTYFNEKNNQIEILPGAKRRLEEIGKTMGLNGHELQTMAINAGNLDYKMKQIKFSPDIKDEDRELVATMSQIGAKGSKFEGKAVVQVEQIDKETGKGTGVYVDKLVEKLTEQDVRSLAQQQLDNSMSMEDIAHSQLDQLKQLNSNINEVLGAMKYGFAGSKSVQGGYTKSINAIDQSFVDMTKGINVDEISAGITKDMTKVTDFISLGWEEITNYFKDYFGDFIDSAKSIFGIGGGDPTEFENNTQTASTSVLTQSPNETVVNALNNTTTTNTTNTSATTNIEIKHTFDFTNLPANMTTEQIKAILTEWAKNPINANELVMAAAKINSGIINQ
jgi:uncharacterized protein YoxC